MAGVATFHEQVRRVNLLAFSGPAEAALVDALRGSSGCVSLVATAGRAVVGHILFTPVQVLGPSARARVAGLGPMAVLPEHQRQGVGSRMVQVGLDECRRLGYEAVVLVGHPSYYPRLGFVRGSHYGLRVEFDVPDEAFMALELLPGALAGGGGEVRYAAEFSRA